MNQPSRCFLIALVLPQLFLSTLMDANRSSQLSAEQAGAINTEYSSYDGEALTTSGTGAWLAGVDLVFVRPQFDNNVAFTRTESNGVSFSRITDVPFDHGFSLATRPWVAYETIDAVGLRASYFALDDSAPLLTAAPPANGFGRIDHPAFGAVNISSTVPAESFRFSSGLELYSIDLEVTKRVDFGNWDMLASTGIRYASIQQDYLAQLRNAAGVLAGQIDFRHGLDGIGPTLAIQTHRPLSESLGFFGQARGSVLFGEGESVLSAGEDLDLVNPFFTTRTTNRNDTLPIGEIQVGFDWLSAATSFGQLSARVAFEGQIWGDVGNATSETGSLGLLGFSVGIGLAR